MRNVLLMLLSMMLATGLMAQVPKTHLKVGDMAPDFTLAATTGDDISLSDYRGKSTVVLGFFPAAFTGGCTREANAYTQGVAKFEQAGAQVLMVSTNALPTLRHWVAELGSSFPMLSDFQRTVVETYGVLNKENGFANRTTFVIDKQGRIQFIEEGTEAVDPNSALEACTRVAMTH